MGEQADIALTNPSGEGEGRVHDKSGVFDGRPALARMSMCKKGVRRKEEEGPRPPKHATHCGMASFI